MFKTLVCFALFFIAVGAAGAWFTQMRKTQGRGPRH
jgi:hypothetical protein